VLAKLEQKIILKKLMVLLRVFTENVNLSRKKSNINPRIRGKTCLKMCEALFNYSRFITG